MEASKKQIQVVSTFRPFAKQQSAIDEFGKARFVNLQCANRSGKSETVIECLSRFVFTEGNAKNKSVVISTNHAIIDDILVQPFLLRWGRDIVAEYNKALHYLKLKNGHTILLVSPENPSALESRSKVAAIFIDEPLTVPQSLFNAAKTRGIDCGAHFLIAGTPVLSDISKPPVGIHWYKQLCEMGRNPKYCDPSVPERERIVTFQWGIEDNPYIDRAEIEIIRKDPFMSEAEKKCRLYGDFMDLGIYIFESSLLDPDVCGYYPEELDHLRPISYQTVDLATGQRASAREDETAIVTVSIGPDYSIYVRKCNASRMPPDEIEKNIIADYGTFDVRYSGIESVAFQAWFVDRMRKSQLHDGSMRFRKIKRHGGMDGKPTRHARLVPFLENRRLKFPRNRAGDFLFGTDKLVSQMKQVTYVKNESIHDDCVDALADIVNPDMEIISGASHLPPPPEEDVVDFPLMTQKEFDRMMGSSTSWVGGIEPN